MTINNIIVNKLREVKEGVFTETMDKIKSIQSIADQFESTNLKIYNVAYYLNDAVQAGVLTNEQELSLFQEIANREYECFEEWEKQNLHYIKRSYIGRSSSFFYSTNWEGDVIDNETLEGLLEGKTIHMLDWHGDLLASVYDFLVDGVSNFEQITDKIYSYIGTKDESENEADWIEEFKSELDELLEDEINILESLNDELDTVLEIILEGKKAYEYIANYKTEKHEREITDSYLEYEIENYVSENEAEKIYNEALKELIPLNKLETVEVTGYHDALKYTWYIDIVTNLGIRKVNTKITSLYDMEDNSKLLVTMIVCHLREMFDQNFDINKEV